MMIGISKISQPSALHLGVEEEETRKNEKKVNLEEEETKKNEKKVKQDT